MTQILAIPTLVLWAVALIVSCTKLGPIAGVPQHTYAGWLFVAAVAASFLTIMVGAGRETLNDRASRQHQSYHDLD